MATGYDLYKNIGDIGVCTEFKMLKVKVPIFFSAQWVSRYLGRDVTAFRSVSIVRRQVRFIFGIT